MKGRPVHLHGFSLVEVAVALAIAAFALMILFGLLATGLHTNQEALPKTTAINIASAICADLHQTPTAAQITASGSTLTTKSPRYSIDVTQSSTTLYLDESGTVQTSAATAGYKAIITLTQPASGQRTATEGTLVISWPAAAIPSIGSISIFIALDRN